MEEINGRKEWLKGKKEKGKEDRKEQRWKGGNKDWRKRKEEQKKGGKDRRKEKMLCYRKKCNRISV